MKLSWVEQKVQVGRSSDQMTSGKCGRLLVSEDSNEELLMAQELPLGGF